MPLKNATLEKVYFGYSFTVLYLAIIVVHRLPMPQATSRPQKMKPACLQARARDNRKLKHVTYTITKE